MTFYQGYDSDTQRIRNMAEKMAGTSMFSRGEIETFALVLYEHARDGGLSHPVTLVKALTAVAIDVAAAFNVGLPTAPFVSVIDSLADDVKKAAAAEPERVEAKKNTMWIHFKGDGIDVEVNGMKIPGVEGVSMSLADGDSAPPSVTLYMECSEVQVVFDFDRLTTAPARRAD